jgi:molybdopterin/thiamine biosynthesis adenylyltransferase
MSTKPRLKGTNPVYEHGDRVLIPQCGSMLEIEDVSGDVRTLIGLLDGARTTQQVADEFHAARPGSAFDVPDALSQLDQAGLIEDATAPTSLDAYGLERWKRNIGFFETYAGLSGNKYTAQEKLNDRRVGMMGCGGVGSHVALDLLGLGVGDLKVLDCDKVELSNLNRQILYTEADIGERKVDLAVRRLSAYHPNAKISGVDRLLSSVDDVYDFVSDRDFVFSLIDRPKMHIANWVNEACVRARVPLIGGGVETQRSVMYMMVPGVTGCVECWRRANANTERTQAVRDQMAEVHTGAGLGPDLAAFGPMVTVITALFVTEFVRYVTGVAKPLAAGKLVEIRFDDLAIRPVETWERDPDCPVCGGVEAVH